VEAARAGGTSGCSSVQEGTTGVARQSVLRCRALVGRHGDVKECKRRQLWLVRVHAVCSVFYRQTWLFENTTMQTQIVLAVKKLGVGVADVVHNRAGCAWTATHPLLTDFSGKRVPTLMWMCIHSA
jgi:hypothetical protein